MDPAGRPRLFIVDDDDDIRDALTSALTPAMEVATARNGREALSALEAGLVHPDVILLDIMMPVLDGWGFLGAIAADAALVAIPIVTMTAAVTLDPVARGHPGVRAHLTKPFELEALEQLVATLAASRSPR